MKNNMTGDKIDYSLRVQKNVERKIFIDIIRSLNFFRPVEEYRYIGFGSCYYKDFLLLHEKYNITTGISIERDNTVYGKYEDKKSCYLKIFSKWLKDNNDLLRKWLCEEIENGNIVYTNHEIVSVSREIANLISTSFFEMISSFEEHENVKYKINSIYNYNANNEKIKEDFTQSIIDELSSALSQCCADESSNKYMFNDEAKVSLKEKLTFVIDDFYHILLQSYTNRYIFNKPYGHIRNIFKELNLALDDIEWDKNCNSIIWLDFDTFLENDQLNGLEKTLMNSQRGDLIIFSTSMGDDADLRKESLDEIRKENKNRIGSDVTIKECDNKEIPLTIRKIVKETVENAISKKNNTLPEDSKPYRTLDVFDCTYADGMRMYTYAMIVYCESDDIDSKYFPKKQLENNTWFFNEKKPYNIYVPALTHKEICFINQLIPQNNLEEIATMLPFINKNSIKRYIEIWRYYPNFFEVDNYV